ncbi:hypothetical protein V2J09_010376 [Rumex salicifolius]
MAWTTSSPSSYAKILLLTFFFAASFFILPSTAAASDDHSLQITSSSDCLSKGGRRWIAEVGGDNSSFMLAEKRTYRRDPSDDFKRYSGGWNISNYHYWTSVGYTAAPFFFIAAVWFLFFGLMLCCTCLYFCCCQKPTYGYSRACYAFSLILLLFFTLAAITGCAFLYTGQAKFHRSTDNTLDYVVGQADATAKNLTSVSSYLDSAKTIGVDQLSVPENILSKINNIQVKIDSSSATLSTKTHDNSRKIERALNIVRITLIVISAVMLFLAFIGFCNLVLLGWLLVTATFILCGVFLVLHNVVADTCVAMDQWVEHPTAHTALDDILPCVDNATTQDILQQSKDINRQLVVLVDTALQNISNANIPPNGGSFYYNQSGPFVPLLCNPYNSDLTDQTCSQGEVNYTNAVEVWRNFLCQVSSDNRNCTTVGRLKPSHYEQLIKATNVSYGLYTYTPFLVNLADCSFVRSTFSDISKVYCPGLRKYTQWIYVGLVMVSAAVMFSLILWVVYARERRHRVYTKLVAGSNGHS